MWLAIFIGAGAFLMIVIVGLLLLGYFGAGAKDTNEEIQRGSHDGRS